MPVQASYVKSLFAKSWVGRGGRPPPIQERVLYPAHRPLLRGGEKEGAAPPLTSRVFLFW
jgi:hypothetical protein